MRATTEGRKRRRTIPRPEWRELLSHPWRVRVMEALYQREMSSSQLVDEAVIPELAEEPREEALSLLSYHVRKLRDGGLIELVRTVPGRGSDEQIYRAREGAHHTNEEWAKLSRNEREAITPHTLSNLTGLAENAVLYGSFDNRVDRHLSYDLAPLDAQAWSELGPVLDGVLEIFQRVRSEAEGRLRLSGEKPIPTVLGLALFESPSLPAASTE